MDGDIRTEATPLVLPACEKRLLTSLIFRRAFFPLASACPSGWGLPSQVGNELFDPLVVEDDRHPARPEEDCYPVAEDQSPRMVNLEPCAAPQHDRERAKRRALLERGEGLVEMICSHCWHHTNDKATPVSYRAGERLHSPPELNLVAPREQRPPLTERPSSPARAACNGSDGRKTSMRPRSGVAIGSASRAIALLPGIETIYHRDEPGPKPEPEPYHANASGEGRWPNRKRRNWQG